MTGRALIVRADARALPLSNASVDLIVTSPPYYALRSYTDGGQHYGGQIGSEPTPAAYVEALLDCTREMMRVLKPAGSIWVNLGDKYATSLHSYNYRDPGTYTRKTPQPDGEWSKTGWKGKPNRQPTSQDPGIGPKSLIGLPWRYALACIDQLGLILRAEVIWSKPNGLPESVTDRVRRSHEQWFHLVKQPRYFSAVDEIRETYAPGTATRYAAGYNPRRVDQARPSINTKLGGDTYGENPLGKLPGSVWTIPTEPLTVPDHLGVDHFAAFPTEWPRRIILGWSPSGICTVCGEGRRPVVDAERIPSPVHRDGSIIGSRRSTGDIRGWDGLPRFNMTRELTGYACACPEPTAPTRPAVVLDPFGGTGTTALVAHALGRIGISVDRSADYNRIATWRTTNPGEIAKAMRVPKPEPVADAQLVLDLGGVA